MALLDVLTAYPPPLHVDENGTVRVGETRITLDTVLAAHHNGYSPSDIIRKYPTLSLTDVYAVITYYLWHREEVEVYLAQRREQATEIRRKIEARFPPEGVKERLLGCSSRRGVSEGEDVLPPILSSNLGNNHNAAIQD